VIAAFNCGADLRAVPANWDFALSAEFASITDFCQRLAVQFSLD